MLFFLEEHLEVQANDGQAGKEKCPLSIKGRVRNQYESLDDKQDSASIIH